MNDQQMPNGFADSEYTNNPMQGGAQQPFGGMQGQYGPQGQYGQQAQYGAPNQFNAQFGGQNAYNAQNAYNPQGQYGAQYGYQQPYQGNPQQAYGGYQAGQQNPYGQQGYQQGYNPQQPYQQQPAYQPQDPYQNYAQQQGTPVWQSQQMQQPYAPNPGYTDQNQPPYQPQQPMYQPQQGPELPVVLIAISAVVVLLCVLALILGGTAFRVIACVLSLIGVAALWLVPGIADGMPRIAASGVYGVLAVLCLILALTASPKQPNPNQPAVVPTTDPATQNIQIPPASLPTEYDPQIEEGIGNDVVVDVQQPPETPVPTAENDWMQSECAKRLTSFLYYWSINDTENMVSLCSPSWQRSVSEPKKELFAILSNRIAKNANLLKISSNADSDISRTISAEIEIDKQNRNQTMIYRFSIVMVKENDVWYLDPLSLKSNETATATATNVFPTQPPTPQPAEADTILYYNTDGGVYYHADANCSKVGKSYRPLKGTFRFSQVNNDQFKNLKPCNNCGAPLRNQ